ncbi:hypothetical protein [Streptomyces guryensis]|uniref:Uncharacterized protein n=1 Tax=Streptomyces guryensis TaxID=2886947 RepID=A0A9Q3VY61_9ACTN|nr:hypothetical protein [Streptomyces guryensis]MCD9879471.1 hypothetical protein [Streptomyces guryensis]
MSSCAPTSGGQQLRIDQTVRALCDLVPPRSPYFPDFLTPPPPAPRTGGVRAGIDRVLSTPRSRLRTEIGLLTIHARAPAAALHSVTPLGLRLLGNRTGAAAEERS